MPSVEAGQSLAYAAGKPHQASKTDKDIASNDRAALLPDPGSIRHAAGDLTSLAPLDLDLLVRAAEAAADVAGAVIRPFFRNPLAADLKGDASPVTIADRTAELALRAVLSERFPDHGILGEEFPARNPDASLCWVFDPIDGTRAFITGRPIFGTLIALLHDGVPILGIIDQCITGERWTGVAGRSTQFRGPLGGTSGCRPCAFLADAELSLTSPEMLDGDDHTQWKQLQTQVRRTTYGGDCYAYGLLALGQIDIIAESNMKIWDWAALVPVIEGAGGQLTDWQGKPLTFNSNGHTLATGDPRLFPHAVALLDGRGQDSEAGALPLDPTRPAARLRATTQGVLDPFFKAGGRL